MDLPAGPYTPTETRQFDLSPTATIKPLFGAFTGVSLSEKLQESSFRTVELEETGEEASGSLRQLQQSLELAKGIIRMANARQGPIMLLSTDILSSVSALHWKPCNVLTGVESGLDPFDSSPVPPFLSAK